jgi:hypothetical protein
MRYLTRRLVHLTDYIDGGPTMCCCDARIRAALEDRGEEIPVLFPVGTPVCRRLRQDSVIFEPSRLLALFVRSEFQSREMNN